MMLPPSFWKIAWGLICFFIIWWAMQIGANMIRPGTTIGQVFFPSMWNAILTTVLVAAIAGILLGLYRGGRYLIGKVSGK